MFNSYRLFRSIDSNPVRGAELRKRGSVFQRSAQGAYAPQRKEGALRPANPQLSAS